MMMMRVEFILLVYWDQTTNGLKTHNKYKTKSGIVWSVELLWCGSVWLPVSWSRRGAQCQDKERGGLSRAPGRALAGHQGRQLLDAHRLLGVKQVIHPEGLLAGRGGGRGRGRGHHHLRLGLGLGGRVLVVPERRGLPRLGHPFTELVQDADGAVLPDPVADLQRVDPHGQLAGEGAVEEGGAEAAAVAGLRDHGVHLAVDADAAVARALERLLGEPVVTVPPPQNLDQTVAKFLQLGFANIALGQTDQMDQKIGRG